MAADEDEEQLLRSVALQNAKSILAARQRAERELVESKEALERKTEELAQANRRLRENEARYRLALKAGRMGTWETDFVTGTRTWSDEGMALFGLTLANGRGHIGGEADEFRSALHPADRHLVQHFHQLAEKQDSFAAEYRIVQPGGKILWLAGRGQVVARGADGKALRLVNIVTDITERKAAEDHIQLLMREISHRSKNLLSVVQAIASQTVRTADTMEEFETRFGRRLQGLAASHDLLVHEGWRGAPLAELVRQQLAPFAGTRSSRLELAGPDVVVTTEAAQAIGLALHELATNAIKYGALAGTTGKVTVSWAFDNNGAECRQLRLSWVERGGPPVMPPAGKGFGHVVIESLVAQSVNGKVAMTFDPQGLSWTLSMPETNLVSETRESAKPPLHN
jgi:two-component sensor histidine kinase